MKKKTVITILCTLFLLLAAYAAYEYVFFAWLSATPLSENDLKRVQFHGVAWLTVLGISIVVAPLLAWWRLRLAGFFSGSRKEPIQPRVPTRGNGR
jgi:hypothetical protein